MVVAFAAASVDFAVAFADSGADASVCSSFAWILALLAVVVG